jgi:hypothetical protein
VDHNKLRLTLKKPLADRRVRGLRLRAGAALALNENKRKFPEAAGNPKIAYETPAPPGNTETKTQKRDTSCARNFFLLQQRQTADGTPPQS